MSTNLTTQYQPKSSSKAKVDYSTFHSRGRYCRGGTAHRPSLQCWKLCSLPFEAPAYIVHGEAIMSDNDEIQYSPLTNWRMRVNLLEFLEDTRFNLYKILFWNPGRGHTQTEYLLNDDKATNGANYRTTKFIVQDNIERKHWVSVGIFKGDEFHPCEYYTEAIMRSLLDLNKLRQDIEEDMRACERTEVAMWGM
jgi:hypothetical protein